MTTEPFADAQHQQALGEIANVPLGERIAAQLREMILDGELEPGTPLVEVALAADLGVSRAPVREALRSLSVDGLVETVPYRGTTVRGLLRRDVEELHHIRTLHEGFAIRRIIASGRQRDLGALHAVCDAMERGGGDVRTLNRLDERFHATLIELADHRLLSTFWRTIAMQVRRVMALSNRRIADARRIAANHRAIVDAVAAADVARAVALLESHVGDVIAVVLRDWAEAESA
jgi:GntR family transcriptional regulator, gluconate operon transcriptional repressor